MISWRLSHGDPDVRKARDTHPPAAVAACFVNEDFILYNVHQEIYWTI